MSLKILDLSPLKKALTSLEAALAEPKTEFIRDSAIQRFEYTYELAWKMLKRQLERDEGSESVDHLGRKDLYRLAAEKGLIADVEAWFQFHADRNRTSHTYNESTAEDVYQTACRFAPAARALLAELEKKNHD